MQMSEYRFPETFLESGKDEDHSYHSLKTIRLKDGKLKIDIEIWDAYGSCFSVKKGVVIETYTIIRCGTDSSEIWGGKFKSYIVEEEEENKAQQIKFRNLILDKAPSSAS
jgi:hypothetical protein